MSNKISQLNNNSTNSEIPDTRPSALADYVRALVDGAPPLTPEQKATLAQLVTPTIRGTGASPSPGTGAALNPSPEQEGEETPVRPVQSGHAPIPVGPAPNAPRQDSKRTA